jgi:SAM-dependent methyltransferase
MVAILSLARDRILEAVQAMYTDVATQPERTFHFPTGRSACRFVGYPDQRLDPLPATAVESFAGVGYPFAADVIRPGHRVLDIGSGSGTDVLIAASLVGPEGHVHALDLTPAMREKLKANLQRSGAQNVSIHAGNAEEIPLPTATVDVVTSNGVLNLVPDKRRAIGEISRVLCAGGYLQLADIVVGRPVSETSRQDPRLWAECIVGAVGQGQYREWLAQAGFERVETLGEVDYFSASTNADTRKVAGSFGAVSIVLRAWKPD